MNEELTRLFEDIEEAAEKASMCCGCNMFAIDNAIQALADYLSTKEITDPQRKCVDKTHHFKGCDCW